MKNNGYTFILQMAAGNFQNAAFEAIEPLKVVVKNCFPSKKVRLNLDGILWFFRCGICFWNIVNYLLRRIIWNLPFKIEKAAWRLSHLPKISSQSVTYRPRKHNPKMWDFPEKHNDSVMFALEIKWFKSSASVFIFWTPQQQIHKV